MVRNASFDRRPHTRWLSRGLLGAGPARQQDPSHQGYLGCVSLCPNTLMILFKGLATPAPCPCVGVAVQVGNSIGKAKSLGAVGMGSDDCN